MLQVFNFLSATQNILKYSYDTQVFEYEVVVKLYNIVVDIIWEKHPKYVG